MPIFGVTEAI